MLSHTIHTYYNLLANLNKFFFHDEIFDRSFVHQNTFLHFQSNPSAHTKSTHFECHSRITD